MSFPRIPMSMAVIAMLLSNACTQSPDVIEFKDQDTAGPAQCALRECLSQFDRLEGRIITTRGYLRYWGGQFALFEDSDWDDYQEFGIDAIDVQDSTSDRSLQMDSITGEFRCTRRYVEITGLLRMQTVLNLPVIDEIQSLRGYEGSDFSGPSFECLSAP